MADTRKVIEELTRNGLYPLRPFGDELIERKACCEDEGDELYYGNVEEELSRLLEEAGLKLPGESLDDALFSIFVVDVPDELGEAKVYFRTVGGKLKKITGGKARKIALAAKKYYRKHKARIKQKLKRWYRKVGRLIKAGRKITKRMRQLRRSKAMRARKRLLKQDIDELIKKLERLFETSSVELIGSSISRLEDLLNEAIYDREQTLKSYLYEQEEEEEFDVISDEELIAYYNDLIATIESLIEEIKANVDAGDFEAADENLLLLQATIDEFFYGADEEEEEEGYGDEEEFSDYEEEF